MAVPTFDEFFLPFLRLVAELGQASLGQAKALLAERMGVSEEDQRELLPSGRQGRYDNRVGWARTYLAKAGLIRTVARGVFEITDAGRQLLATDPPEVTVATLQTYEPFREWQKSSRTSDPVPPISVPPPEGGGTPVEAMNEAFELLRSSLATELAESLQRVSWSHFEQIVIDVLLALGYGGSRSGAGHAFRKSGDGGVDGVIDEDRLGLSKIYVQAKRYAPENKVSRPDVQAFVGSLLGQKARQGVFITTSSFTREASGYVEALSDQRVVLIDGETLAKFMIDHDVGVAEQERFVIKRIDRDYFEES